MRAGKLATMRVNPNDCMSVVDVLAKIGQPTVNMSFSQACKIVLASALEALRQDGVIPTRDGFEYSEMLSVFPEKDDYSKRGQQLKLTKRNSQHRLIVPPVMGDNGKKPEPLTPSQLRRYNELAFKQQHNALNFTDEDMTEYLPLLEQFQMTNSGQAA